MSGKIKQFFLRNSIHKFGKVTPFAVGPAKKAAKKEVPDFLKNTSKKQALKSGILVTKTVRVTSERKPAADTFERGAGAPTASRAPSKAMLQFKPGAPLYANWLANEMNSKKGRSSGVTSRLMTKPLTAKSPNDYLGFPDGWQAKVTNPAHKKMVKTFNTLRNSLDHYAPEFATNKEARDYYRLNYAIMIHIFLFVSKEPYMDSPHDIELW